MSLLSGIWFYYTYYICKKSNYYRNEILSRSIGGAVMKEEYDFSKARKNPYTNKLKKQITINIDADTIDYFKSQSKFSGIPYQTLINLYLSDCAEKKRQPQINWN